MQQFSQAPAPTATRSRHLKALPAAEAADPRWRALAHVQMARRALGISDREIAVLRGLLSLLPVKDWNGQMIVYASNRVVGERSGGVDERTLRRRLVRLEEAGLLMRRLSSNGKRYRLCDADGAPALTFGVDLTPLAALESHLAALAEAERREAIRIEVLRKQIRHRLYLLAEAMAAPSLAQTEARLSLRRNCTAAALEQILDALAQDDSAANVVQTTEVTASDSQIVRHIQKSDKESFEKEERRESDRADQSVALETEALGLQECLESATTAVEFALEPVRSWPDLSRLAHNLAPAIGIDARAMETAKRSLGEYGSTLAVLGLTQSVHRIKQPSAYLSALSRKAQEGGLDCVRMFRSLTARRTAAGAMAAAV